jgi:hypothetical protein
VDIEEEVTVAIAVEPDDRLRADLNRDRILEVEGLGDDCE